MRHQVFQAALFLLFGFAVVAAEGPGAKPAGDDWKVASTSGNITIYSRPHSGSSLKEFKAIGQIEASSRAVHGVITDYDAYPRFMPYVAECRLLSPESDSFLAYQRISPKVCSDRDYVLRVRRTSWPVLDGLVFSDKWETTGEPGPPPKPNCLRVKVCQGSWLLEPDGPGKTRATYLVYTDTGGLIPAFIANHFAQTGIDKVFAAVRRQVRDPKYALADRPLTP